MRYTSTKAQHKSGFCHNLIICCEIYQIWYSSKRSNTNVPILKLRRRNLMYNSSIITATHMSHNYFPCVKGRSINNIRKYLPIFRDTLITDCCLCSYICTVVLEAGNRVCSWKGGRCINKGNCDEKQQINKKLQRHESNIQNDLSPYAALWNVRKSISFVLFFFIWYHTKTGLRT